MNEYLAKPYESSSIDVKINLSNYTTRVDVKNATGVNTFYVAAKSDFPRLKAEVNEICIDKLKIILLIYAN